jgi:RNA polymerase sigma-70 factor (ECF subfamily)
VSQQLRYRRQVAEQGACDGCSPEPVGDHQLALAAIADPALFEQLFTKYWATILRYCSMRLADPADAEDAAIRVMTNAFAALPHFVSGTGQFRSWLFAIAHNEVVNVYRSHARQPMSPMPEELDLVDPHPTPEQLALASDDRYTLWQLLQELPQRSREVVELRLSGFTGQEIAAMLGISNGAVRQAQSRAVAQLRQIVIDDNTVREGQRD